jgi:hypothetical protein
LGFKVSTDVNGVLMRIQKNENRALPALSMQVLKDCNYYCKQDQGGLIASSLTASDLNSGILIWDTKYANRQYWLPATSTDVNANASYMWCHKAYNRFGKSWGILLQKLFEEG